MQLFFKNSYSFSYIFSFDWSNSEFTELLLKVFQNFFYVSILTIRGDFFINEKRVTFFWRFWNLRDKTLDFCDFSEKLWARSSKLFSASPVENFVDKLFS